MSDRGYEALSLEIQAQAIMVVVEGMKAENMHRQYTQQAVEYYEDSFQHEAEKLLKIAEQVRALAG